MPVRAFVLHLSEASCLKFNAISNVQESLPYKSPVSFMCETHVNSGISNEYRVFPQINKRTESPCSYVSVHMYIWYRYIWMYIEVIPKMDAVPNYRTDWQNSLVVQWRSLKTGIRIEIQFASIPYRFGGKVSIIVSEDFAWVAHQLMTIEKGRQRRTRLKNEAQGTWMA